MIDDDRTRPDRSADRVPGRVRARAARSAQRDALQRDTTPGVGRTVVTAAGALIVATLPMFLLGSLSGRISEDLGIGGATVGAMVAVFFAAGSASSIPGGLLTDRIGATAALRVAGLIAAVSSTAVAALAVGPVAMLGLFVVAGTAVAMADTGGARAIASAIPVARQGAAFGGKEASIPAASMLAGLALPVLGAQLGWRSAYVFAALLSVLFVLSIPRGLGPTAAMARSLRHQRDGDGDEVAPGSAGADGDPGRHPDPGTNVSRVDDGVDPTRAGDLETPSVPSDRQRRHVLVLLAVAAGLGGGAATATPTFLVPAATEGGWTESAAGLLLAGSSIVGITMRLLVGLLADRRVGREIVLTVLMMCAGVGGLFALALGGPAVTTLGALLALGGGWGWTGLVFLAAVRTHPRRPAGAAGTVLAGLGAGGATGPAAFGWLVDHPGYPTAWTSAAFAMLLAAGLGTAADLRRRRLFADPGSSSDE